MSFNSGEEVLVAIIKSHKAGSCEGVVIGTADERLQIALKGFGLMLKHGNMLHVRSNAEEGRSAWASVESVALAGDVKIVCLSNIRFEGAYQPRAARFPIEIAISAGFTDRQSNGQTTHGQTVNVSITGLRAKLDAPLPIGTIVHVNAELEEGKTLEAMAKVVRIIEGAESASGGFEVGLEFHRYLRGYEHLLLVTQSDQAA